MSLRRKESSTAFLSHWLTRQSPFCPRSATRALPRSSRSSAASTASRTAPLVAALMPSRVSKASSMVLASSACDMGRRPSANLQSTGAPDRRVVENRGAEVNRSSRNALQKAGEIVGDVVDMGRVAPLELPALAEDLAGVLRHHQHRGHAESVRHRKVAREVLEHRRLPGIDAVRSEEAVVGLRRGLGLELGRDDVEHVLEMAFELKPREHRVGVAARAVGQDQLAPRQALDRRAQCRVRRERRMIDLMHKIEEVVGLHPVLGHQAAHRGAVSLVVVLLHPERLLAGDLEEIRDVIADAFVHLLPEIEVMGVERIVEVEHPGVDPVEGAWRGAARRIHDWAATRSLMTRSTGRLNAKMTAPANAAMPAIIRKNIPLSMLLQKLPSQPARRLPVKLVASHSPISIDTMRAGATFDTSESPIGER